MVLGTHRGSFHLISGILKTLFRRVIDGNFDTTSEKYA